MGALQLPTGQDLSLFFCFLISDALNKIPSCSIVVISNPAHVCDFHPMVFSEIKLFAELGFLVFPFSDRNLASKSKLKF